MVAAEPWLLSAGARRAPAEGQIVATGPYILVAEDNFDILEAMREVLESEGFRVTCAHNGAEALRCFQRETPDLLVSDVMMPQMDGFALLSAVRAHPNGAALPFLFLSARTEAAATTQARNLGADDYLFKPFAADDLLMAVRAKLERRRVVIAFDTRSAHLQTVQMLANVIEARDATTSGHVQRVQELAMELAQALSWSSEALVVLNFGALLHDIGKILVPVEILNKPGRLDRAEWEILKRHTEDGAQMLGRVDHLRAAVPYVRHHHEQWDGTGYPDGLAGTKIPIEGRLLAIVDAYDAMTNLRPYQGVKTSQAATAEILAGRGRQFDPVIADVFARLRRV
jgi:putative two-component system response regulator